MSPAPASPSTPKIPLCLSGSKANLLLAVKHRSVVHALIITSVPRYVRGILRRIEGIEHESVVQGA